MAERIGGIRPRPRVAILGKADEISQNYFNHLFPTVWIAQGSFELSRLVDHREIDLFIVLPDFSPGSYERPVLGNYIERAHIICFSSHLTLPGPIKDSQIHSYHEAETEEYQFTDIPLLLSRQREMDFFELTSVRGFHIIKDHRESQLFGHSAQAKSDYKIYQDTKKALLESALVLERATQSPLAVSFKRNSLELWVAFLPNPVFGLAWVELLCQQWAETDRERFPNFGNWLKMPEWMMPSEIALAEEFERLEARRLEINREIDTQLATINQQQVAATLSANLGRRRLITAQGAELVEEVASVFQEFGFGVQVLDDEIDPALAKREDLRLTVTEDPDWEAIVEVRGYARASGQTNDFQRLARFATLYLKEKSREPDKRILVVNGEIEVTHPSRRHEPFSAAAEDVEVFAEDNGVIIWSLDLFRQAKQTGEVPAEMLRKSIMEARGRWQG